MRRFSATLVALGLALALPGAAAAQDAGTGSPNLDLVRNVPYPAKVAGKAANYGTDIEFATIGGRRYAVAGSYYNGLRLVDITKPSRPHTASVYDCPVRQGDVQVFKAADGSRRTLATYTADATESAAIAKTGCFEEAARMGFKTRLADGRGRQGTFLVDISNPRAPKTVSFVEVPQGSHNMTVHPSGGWLYNSNSELIAYSTAPAVELIDIRDPDAPRKAGELALEARPGLGTESHDITFNRSGTRAYSAALSHGVVIDTTNPGAPKVVSTWDDEAINVWHQVDPFTITDRSGKRREFLIAEDEFAGAAGGPVCPSGGVHVFEITGELERAPKKVGYWNIEEAGPTHDPEGTCTAHVFDIHEREQLMTMAFYNGGVRVIDLAGLATGDGIKAIASYRTANADSWSFKAPSVTRRGTFFAFGNDIARGLDVYRYDGRRAQSSAPGTWVPGLGVDSSAVPAAGLPQVPTAAGASRGASAGSASPSLAGYRMTCLLGSTQ